VSAEDKQVQKQVVELNFAWNIPIRTQLLKQGWECDLVGRVVEVWHSDVEPTLIHLFVAGVPHSPTTPDNSILTNSSFPAKPRFLQY